MTLHVRGRGLPDGQSTEWWIVDGTLSAEPVKDAQTVFDGGWIVPGLVDAHCHVGLGQRGAVELDEAIAQAETERDVGALLLRDAGSPTDTRSFDDRHELPRIIRAGRHLARPKRYQRGFAIELEDEWQLPDALEAAIDAAHANGARVTAHVFSEDALPGLIRAGIDCIEHGTGLTEDTVDMMVAYGTALVPTVINIENFPGIAAAAASRYPRYERHMRALHETCAARIGAAREAGVPIYAGSDAGSAVAHGRIADEGEALKGIGMTPTEALGAACWDARRWLRRPALEHGASADLVCYADDPRGGAAV